jgi:hypothetical protein
MWLLSDAPDDSEDDTVMEKYAAAALYSTLKSLMDAFWTKTKEAQQDGAYWMMQIAKPWSISRRLELKLANGKPLVHILKENSHLIHLEWNEDEQAKLKSLVERYTSQGASVAWRVPRWR